MKTQTTDISSRHRHNIIGRKCFSSQFECSHCKGGLQGVHKTHDKRNVSLRRGPIWNRDGIKKWLDKSFNQEHFSMIEDLNLGDEAKVLHEEEHDDNNNEIQSGSMDPRASPKAPPPSEDGEEVEDIGKLASQMEKMEFNTVRAKEQQLLENHINYELNKTFSSDSIWTKDSISNWLDEGTSETWSLVELVQEIETRSNANTVEPTTQATASAYFNLDLDSSEDVSNYVDSTLVSTTCLKSELETYFNDQERDWVEMSMK